MITTSSFSSDAREYVSKIDNKIVLVDGDELADLMIDHNLGVSSHSELRGQEARYGLLHGVGLLAQQ